MFAGVTITFTVSEKSIHEAIGIVTLEVSVESGTLQHSVDIGFRTVEITSGAMATSGRQNMTSLFIYCLLIC